MPVNVCRYAIFVEELARISTGNLDWVKDKALKAAYELLVAKAELEGQLLTVITNKLGDPNRRVASKAGYLLSCLLTQHPLMASVVVSEVESFLFRCGVQTKR
jgi:ribosome biogenesis protein MAK21